MKSPMVEAADYITAEDKSGYTDLKVLSSPAGWYVGTMYVNRDKNGKVLFEEPGSRDTGYFATKEQADAYLVGLSVGEDLPVRMNPNERG